MGDCNLKLGKDSSLRAVTFKHSLKKVRGLATWMFISGHAFISGREANFRERSRLYVGYSRKSKAVCVAFEEQARQGDGGEKLREVLRGQIMCFHLPVG